MKNYLKIIKNWLAFILTGLVVATLFGIIFIKTELVQPTADFFIELSIVLALTFMMKVWWYDYAEDKALNEPDMKTEKDNYFHIVDSVIDDSNDLEDYLEILNQENKDNYIKRKIGARNPKNLAKKTKWLCFWHPSFKKMTPEEIGLIRYNRLLFKYQRKADKIRPVKSCEIMALSDSRVLYDSKNHAKDKKRTYQIVTTVISFFFSTLLACMAMKEIMMNWMNVFRYIAYLCAITYTIATTLIKGYRQTTDETLDYLSRLKFIIDKYATYKEKRAKVEVKIEEE